MSNLDDGNDVLACDRTGWDSGPWDGEPDKLVWKTEAGLPGMIARNRLGALCGYVAVTREHPLYGADRPDVEVHGGLTYANACSGNICHVPEPGEPDDVWWFGFDCNHGGDYAPSTAAWGKRIGAALRRLDRETYRDIGYVRAEVELLAVQLAGPLEKSDGGKE
ncbi:MAG: hypothetical protein QOG85_827 [Gaiellaceae bacterium]|jgi:hypothetical protein|nr:hypothetical protein [Gaiellaceae bacterium]